MHRGNSSELYSEMPPVRPAVKEFVKTELLNEEYHVPYPIFEAL